jgi:hypothetical protein
MAESKDSSSESSSSIQTEVAPLRRSFLKKSAVVVGGATLGSLALYEVFRPKGEVTSNNLVSYSDAEQAYAYFGPAGEITTVRDSRGNISSLTYGPLTIVITRNIQGTVAFVQTSLSLSSKNVVTQIDTINRNPDGSVSGVNRQRPS